METLPRNNGQPWTEEADQELSRLFCDGCTVAELADGFGRTELAIRCRLQRLGYEQALEYVSNNPLKRYMVLGFRASDGHVRKLSALRGRTPDRAITQATRMDMYHEGEKGHDVLVLITIDDGSGELGGPLATRVQVIALKPPVAPYDLIDLDKQNERRMSAQQGGGGYLAHTRHGC